MQKSIFLYFLLFSAGAVSGVINGLIGVGGGIVIVYVLSYFCRKNDSIESRDIFSAAVASILPMSAVSVFVYMGGGETLPDVGRYIIPAAAGGVSGAFLLDKISSVWLKRIFSALVVWAGISLFMKGMNSL